MGKTRAGWQQTSWATTFRHLKQCCSHHLGSETPIVSAGKSMAGTPTVTTCHPAITDSQPGNI
jgi:hypothetical protein